MGFSTGFWEEWGDGGATTAPVTGFASNRGLLPRQIGHARLALARGSASERNFALASYVCSTNIPST
jgi:hypothetical protein